jgi:zinc transport system substrate-binding protein
MTRRALRSPVLAVLVVLAACSSKSSTSPPAPSPAPAAAAVAPLRIGVTLHAYDSWVRNIVANVPNAEVVPILPADLDVTHAPPATPDDGGKLAQLDVLVMNGVGQDDFVASLVKASGNTKLFVITANEGTQPAPASKGEQPNAYTYVSFKGAIEQSRLIARKLGELRPELADQLGKNAAAYGEKLRALQEATVAKLAAAKQRRVILAGDAFHYLAADLGLEVAGVVDPAQAQEAAASAKAQKLPVIGEGSLSTQATGPYSADAFEKTMAANADALVRALVGEATL